MYTTSGQSLSLRGTVVYMNIQNKDVVLRTDDLSFKNFLHFPNMNILKGSVTFISGESGTGKSTLLRLFNGTHTPSSGSVFFNDQELETFEPIELRRTILLAGQSVFLFDKTIQENFSEFFTYRGEVPPSDDVINKCLAVCRADFPLISDCHLLSGGERQRVFLAICLSMNSEVLLLDEPTSALDGINGKKVMKNICDFCRDAGKSLIVVSHDVSLAESFADNEIVITRDVSL